MNWKLAYFLKFWETSTNANFLPYLSPNPILSLIPPPNHLFLSHTFHSFYHHHHHQMLDSEILRITRQTDKKQIIFYHDKGINFPVEKEFQQLWRNTSVDGLQDDNIEEYLNKQVRVVNGRLLPPPLLIIIYVKENLNKQSFTPVCYFYCLCLGFRMTKEVECRKLFFVVDNIALRAFYQYLDITGHVYRCANKQIYM